MTIIPLIRDRIRYCRTKIKELAAVQKDRKAELRKPHTGWITTKDATGHYTFTGTPAIQILALGGAIELTMWHMLLNELKGMPYSHKSKWTTDGVRAMVEAAVPDPESQHASA